MKVKWVKQPDGYEIQPGDYILVKTMLDEKFRPYKVTRVTAKYSFVRWNDVAEGKYPRVWKEFSFESFPRSNYPTTRYLVAKKVEVPDEPAQV